MEIYLAGGCFWGVQQYIKQIDGVVNTICGYANSEIKNPTYEQVCNYQTNAVETVKVVYDENIINLKELLRAFFNIINPCSLNFQAGDKGTQYRSGIYLKSQDQKQLDTIKTYIKNNVQPNYKELVVTQVQILENFYEAEQYHQNYLDKNPNGYCHINVKTALEEYKKNTKKD